MPHLYSHYTMKQNKQDNTYARTHARTHACRHTHTHTRHRKDALQTRNGQLLCGFIDSMFPWRSRTRHEVSADTPETVFGRHITIKWVQPPPPPPHHAYCTFPPFLPLFCLSCTLFPSDSGCHSQCLLLSVCMSEWMNEWKFIYSA